YNSEPLKSLEEAALFIEQRRREYAEHRSMEWAVLERQSGRVIGLCGFGSWSERSGWVVIGYDLQRDRWGPGLANESARRIIAFAFEEMFAHRIEASTISDNIRSVRLLERLGFRREGVRRERSLEDDGRHHDSVLYGLLRDEFRNE